ncbi:MAG: RloB domain-containing protein [Cytophagales bacterium]|nr:MAG: RloB domain-containing protein [Cytophagales bacterium]
MARINNKNERQIANKKAHKQRISKQPNLERQVTERSEKMRILIVCEGENTEVDYFNEFKKFFKINNAEIIVIASNPKTPNIRAKGTNPLKIVQKANEMYKLAKKNKKPYDKVWCVFDHDPRSDNPKKSIEFNNAIKKAESLGFDVAYSNQSFEFSLLLHFEDSSGSPLHRDLFYDKINSYLKKYNLEYDKDKKHITPAIFEILQAIDSKEGKTRQELAVERAKRIIEKWEKADPSRSNPAKEESSTTVFKLVEELINYKS